MGQIEKSLGASLVIKDNKMARIYPPQKCARHTGFYRLSKAQKIVLSQFFQNIVKEQLLKSL